MLYDGGQHTGEGLRLRGKRSRGVLYDGGEDPEEALRRRAHESALDTPHMRFHAFGLTLFLVFD